MKRSDKREQLIEAGKQIVIKQGFNAASLNEILAVAEVPKGSFYYYFASKEEFGLAIIDRFAEKYSQKLQQYLKDPDFSYLIRLRNYLEAGIAEMQLSQCQDGCLMGNLAQELSSQNELFRHRLTTIFLQWEQAFANCLNSAKAAEEFAPKQDTSVLARFVLSCWQGAILQSKLAHSTTPMEECIETLFATVISPK